MEEAELLKERLQAITNKRKIQEDIASKRLEIDREKLKLQHLKKKSMRDLWLMDGAGAGNVQETQKVQEDVRQTKLLQSNIHRIEKEIETLEREELNISTNEGLILRRLKAIEKSPEDIIKAANENFRSEPIHVYSGVQDTTKPFTPLNQRRKPIPNDQDPNTDQHKPALLAMEINVQKDLRTGESRVISTSTVSTQELQSRGIKVYDDGRKSVYALRSDAAQPGANGVDELSPKEVEELLRQATERKKRSQEQEDSPFRCSPSPSRSHRDQGTNGFLTEPYIEDMSLWPELVYCHSGVDYSGPEADPPAHMFHHFSEGQVEYYASNGNHSHNLYQNTIGPFYSPQDRGTLHVDPDLNQRPPSAYSSEPRASVLNALPSDEPVTMIFMGYQTADKGVNGYEDSVRAELVVIGDTEEESTAKLQQRRLQQNNNASNTKQSQLQATGGATGSKKTNDIKSKCKCCCMLM